MSETPLTDMEPSEEEATHKVIVSPSIFRPEEPPYYFTSWWTAARYAHRVVTRNPHAAAAVYYRKGSDWQRVHDWEKRRLQLAVWMLDWAPALLTVTFIGLLIASC